MPFGHVESNEGGVQKLGRSSRASIYYLLAGSLLDLRGFARDADVQGRSHADEYGRLRSGPGGIGLKSIDPSPKWHANISAAGLTSHFCAWDSRGKTLFGPLQSLTLLRTRPGTDFCDRFFGNARPDLVGRSGFLAS